MLNAVALSMHMHPKSLLFYVNRFNFVIKWNKIIYHVAIAPIKST